MIEAVSKQAEGGQQFVLSFDGKLLRSGLTKEFGDIDMGGIETRPTLQERQERLRNELDIVKHLQIQMSRLEGDRDIKDLSRCEKDEILDNMRSAVRLVTLRIKDARQAKLNKETAIANMITAAGGESKWKESKLVNGISRAKCDLYMINQFIEDALDQSRKVCLVARTLHGIGR